MRPAIDKRATLAHAAIEARTPHHFFDVHDSAPKNQRLRPDAFALAGVVENGGQRCVCGCVCGCVHARARVRVWATCHYAGVRC
ncbi:hypothetical protein EON67_08205 [archaeon]|nr:MAG: hypothetical protein EON67_08205 [archaeon]